MTLYSVAKTLLKENQISNIIEDRMIIQKRGNLGKLYYDFDNNTRIEICPNRLYKVESLSDKLDISTSGSIHYYNSEGLLVSCSIDDILINSLICDADDTIGIIKNVINNNIEKSIEILKIYDPNISIAWTDVK